MRKRGREDRARELWHKGSAGRFLLMEIVLFGGEGRGGNQKNARGERRSAAGDFGGKKTEELGAGGNMQWYLGEGPLA